MEATSVVPVKPVTLEIAHPETLSRKKLLLKVLLGWVYVTIPHGILLAIYGMAASAVTFIAFWIILFTGKYPKGLFDFVIGQLRWQTRVTAYVQLLRDEYPPFNGRP